jgi:uncharacterized protein (DUF1684 family)
MTELDDFREEKNAFFKNHPQSPLTREQKRAFTGLNYFPENPELRLRVAVEPLATKETVQMQTSTGDVQTYQKYGRFKFAVEGQEAELTVYASENGLFLPFADALAGTETYGAGRYLEPEGLEGEKFLVDFNLAYNPYCAYNDKWSCPIPPRENRLLVAVRAGEKMFHAEGDEH